MRWTTWIFYELNFSSWIFSHYKLIFYLKNIKKKFYLTNWICGTSVFIIYLIYESFDILFLMSAFISHINEKDGVKFRILQEHFFNDFKFRIKMWEILQHTNKKRIMCSLNIVHKIFLQLLLIYIVYNIRTVFYYANIIPVSWSIY